jgi:hypothetical protein
MVFESLVVDLLNKFLGDFVENLDSSQLKIGIWGGKSTMTMSSLCKSQAKMGPVNHDHVADASFYVWLHDACVSPIGLAYSKHTRVVVCNTSTTNTRQNQ